MNRRSFLGWLGAAPIAAPVSAKAVMAESPAGSLARFVGASSLEPGISFEPLTSGGDIVASIEVTSAGQVVRSASARWGSVVAATQEEGDRIAALGLAPGGTRVIPGSVAAGVWPRQVMIPAEAAFLFVDDAGGGP